MNEGDCRRWQQPGTANGDQKPKDFEQSTGHRREYCVEE
jgi:hypothetical protein